MIKRNKSGTIPTKCLKRLKMFNSLDPTRNRICPKCESKNKDEPKKYRVITPTNKD